MISIKFGIRVFSGDEWVWYEDQTIDNYYDSGINIKTFASLEEAKEFAENEPSLSPYLDRIDFFRIPANFEEEEFLMSIIEYDKVLDEHFIKLPEDIIDHLGVAPGDNLSWEVSKEGHIFIQKK